MCKHVVFNNVAIAEHKLSQQQQEHQKHQQQQGRDQQTREVAKQAPEDFSDGQSDWEVGEPEDDLVDYTWKSRDELLKQFFTSRWVFPGDPEFDENWLKVELRGLRKADTPKILN